MIIIRPEGDSEWGVQCINMEGSERAGGDRKRWEVGAVVNTHRMGGGGNYKHIKNAEVDYPWLAIWEFSRQGRMGRGGIDAK